MNIEEYLVFISITSLWLATPGPTVILSIKNGIKFGPKSAFIAILGNILALLILVVVSTMGVGTIIFMSKTGFMIFKYIGSIYLIFIGIKILRVKCTPNMYAFESTSISTSNYSLFSEGFFITLSNPKGLFYVGSLLPQFINSNEVLWLQTAVLFLTIALLQIIVFMSYAIFSDRAKYWLKIQKKQKLLNIISGLAFIGVGISLIL